MHSLADQLDEFYPPDLRIGSHVLNSTSPPLVIAEAGVNHNGQIELARRLIDVAVDAKADAVKFQIFQADELACPQAPTAGYQSAHQQTQQEMLRQLQLSPNEFAQLKTYCDERHITFLVTPFSSADLKTAVELGIRAIKIASTDLDNTVLLEAAMETALPLIVSTGAATPGEIDEAVALFDRHEACDRIMLLHCVSSYPTPLEQACLCTITALMQRYRMWAGYSDHTEGTTAAGLAGGVRSENSGKAFHAGSQPARSRSCFFAWAG